MLDKCGMKSLDELYSDVPEQLLLKRDYDLPDEMSEKEVRDFFRSLADNNRRLTCFAGAGYSRQRYSDAKFPVLRNGQLRTA